MYGFQLVYKSALKELLAALQAAVNEDGELSDPEKQEALQAVGNLAEAAQNPKENAMQRMAKRAAANLNALTEPLTAASKLSEVCKTLLPLVLAVF